MIYDPVIQKTLHAIAFELGKSFPERVMNNDDLAQIGWIAALLVLRPPGHTDHQYQQLQLLAGKREMLDMIRAANNTRHPHGRRIDVSVSDIIVVSDYEVTFPGIEDGGWIEQYDLATHIAKLPPLMQRVVWGRLHEKLNREIGREEKISDSKVSQLFKLGIQVLKNSGLDYESFQSVLAREENTK